MGADFLVVPETKGHISDEMISKARKAGVTDEEPGTVTASLALNILTNYFNVVAGVENDWPVVNL